MYGVNGVRNLFETHVRVLGQRAYEVFADPMVQDTCLFDPAEGVLVVEQDASGNGNWEGAPGVLYDNEQDELFLYTRSRHRFKRGHRARIWRHTGGTNFEKVWEIERNDVGALSLEGAAVQVQNGTYTIYLSYQDAASGDWTVTTMTADHPREFDHRTAAELGIDTGYRHLKDPVIYDGRLYLHAHPWHFLSAATLSVDISRETPVLSGEIGFGRDEQVDPRLTSVLDTEDETVAFYDWRPSYFHTTEERSRYGTFDGETVTPRMEECKTLRSEAGTGSLRYVSATRIRDEIWVFYEKSAANGAHALFLNKIKPGRVTACLNESAD